MVWSSWRRVWVEGRGLEGRRVVALIDSARVVAAGPGTLIPPLGASSPGLGAPIPEPAPFPASHPFWFPCRYLEVVVRRRVRPTSALSGPIARGRGSTGRGLCVLHEGPTYLEYPRPSSSRSPPSCSARWRHQITASNGNQDWSARRTSGLGSKAPRQAQRLGASCALGDISVWPGAGDALGDGVAVPDGVECPRPGRHAPGRVECPLRGRWPAGWRCPEVEDVPEPRDLYPRGLYAVRGAFSTTCGSPVCAQGVTGQRVGCAGDGS